MLIFVGIVYDTKFLLAHKLLLIKRTKRTNLPVVGVSAGAAVLASKACVVGGASVVEEAASVGVEGESVGV